eukprot:gene6166-4444_t
MDVDNREREVVTRKLSVTNVSNEKSSQESHPDYSPSSEEQVFKVVIDGDDGGVDMRQVHKHIEEALNVRDQYKQMIPSPPSSIGKGKAGGNRFALSYSEGIFQIAGHDVGKYSAFQDWATFAEDVQNMRRTVSNTLAVKACTHRLGIMQERSRMFFIFNAEIEERHHLREAGGVFANVHKVDSCVGFSTCIDAQDVLDYIVDYCNRNPNSQIRLLSGRHCTLRELLATHSVGDPKILTVEGLGWQPHVNDQFLFSGPSVEQRNLSAELRNTFLSVNGTLSSRLLRRHLDRMERTKRGPTAAEYALPIYGSYINEIGDIATSVQSQFEQTSQMRWILQFRPLHIPPTWHMPEATSFSDQLENVFRPLFMASLPETRNEHPHLAAFLQQVGGISFKYLLDGPESDFNATPRDPATVTTEGRESELYYLYYIYANLTVLNSIRKRLGLNTFQLRVIGDHRNGMNDLIGGYMLADVIVRATKIQEYPVLQYLCGYHGVGLVVSPLADHIDGCVEYKKHPLPNFLHRCLNVSISTVAPLKFHHSPNPLIEEYATVQKIFRLSALDMTEFARNSVVTSSFPHQAKQEWLGERYDQGANGNEFERSQVTNIRLQFREESWELERNMLRNLHLKRLKELSAGLSRWHYLSNVGEVEYNSITDNRIRFPRTVRKGPDMDSNSLAASPRIAEALTMRYRYIWRPPNPWEAIDQRNLESDFQRKTETFNEDEWVAAPSEAVYISYRRGEVYAWPRTLPTLDDFYKDWNALKEICSGSEVKEFAQKRLENLDHKFMLHLALNHANEAGTTEDRLSSNRDFYQATKVDTHIHLAAGFTPKQMLRFVLKKLKESADDIAMRKSEEIITLGQMFSKAGITENLTVDQLNVQADHTLFERFDNFNNKYNPLGIGDLRSLLLKTDNFMNGRYFAELIRDVFAQYSRDRCTFAENRVSVYGINTKEWANLANWFTTHGMSCKHNTWVIQVPRVFKVFRSQNVIGSFGQYLQNIFSPLWEASLHPSQHPTLHNFLKHVSGFDSVDNEATIDSPFTTQSPWAWTAVENPPYNYYLYYLYANIRTLNEFRASRGFSTFALRPHCGESGSEDHLYGGFLCANSICHGINLHNDPPMQYLYYLAQIGLHVSPLSNNALFLPYLNNPFPEFFRRGLNVSLSTDDPMMFHQTQEPLLEEYSIAARVWGFSPNDLCEIARNSVLQSGFDYNFKRDAIGDRWYMSSSLGNDPLRTHLSDIRVAFRFETYHTEIQLLELCSGRQIPRFMMTSDQEREINEQRLNNGAEEIKMSTHDQEMERMQRDIDAKREQIREAKLKVDALRRVQHSLIDNLTEVGQQQQGRKEKFLKEAEKQNLEYQREVNEEVVEPYETVESETVKRLLRWRPMPPVPCYVLQKNLTIRKGRPTPPITLPPISQKQALLLFISMCITLPPHHLHHLEVEVSSTKLTTSIDRIVFFFLYLFLRVRPIPPLVNHKTFPHVVDMSNLLVDSIGIPQFFAGYSIHFNGIIPQTLIHPSHAVEWRMAERHGAVCNVDFNENVNLLVYRPGYERSEKCRQCLKSGKMIAVPIRWMLDSLLESRQIRLALYQLNYIPEVASRTSTGCNLPHYQHPFFLLKAKEYGIPSSFPPTLLDYLEQQGGSAVAPSSPSAGPSGEAAPPSAGAPPFFEIEPVSHVVLDIYQSALDVLKGKQHQEKADRGSGESKDKRGVEIVSSEQHRSWVDTMLFSGMVIVLSVSLSNDNNLRELLSMCGAQVVLSGNDILRTLRSEATHVVYHRDDKKTDFVIHAAHVKQVERPGLVLCESSWIEDCFLLGELIPPYGMYGPSDKLMETLKKNSKSQTKLTAVILERAGVWEKESSFRFSLGATLFPTSAHQHFTQFAYYLFQVVPSRPSSPPAMLTVAAFTIGMVVFSYVAATGLTAIMAARFRYFLYSTRYLLTFKDLPSKYKGDNKIEISASSKQQGFTNGKRRIRVVFVRHGQSMWNSLFNAFGLGWPKRVLQAVIMETICFFCRPFDSALIDSPLSAKGRKEAGELGTYVKNAKDKISLDPRESVIVSSNLRRAMETALIGLDSRLTGTNERIVVDSSLQEGSSNIDAQSFSTESGKVAPMTIGKIKDAQSLGKYFNPYLNEGNKKIGENVYKRMDKFVRHIFDGASSTCLRPAMDGCSNSALTEVIVVGHSGYFRNFFRRFLPESSSHMAKQKKLQNCGAVSFMLEYDVATSTITVDESTITSVPVSPRSSSDHFSPSSFARTHSQATMNQREATSTVVCEQVLQNLNDYLPGSGVPVGGGTMILRHGKQLLTRNYKVASQWMAARCATSRADVSEEEMRHLDQELPPRELLSELRSDPDAVEEEIKVPGDSFGIMRNRVAFYRPIPRSPPRVGPLAALMPSSTHPYQCYNEKTIRHLRSRFGVPPHVALEALRLADGDINRAVQTLELSHGTPMQFGAYGVVCLESYAPETFCLVSFNLESLDAVQDDHTLDVIHELTLSAAELPLDIPRDQLMDKFCRDWTTEDGTPCGQLLEEYNLSLSKIVLLPHGEYSAHGFHVLNPVKDSVPNIGTAVAACCLDLRTGIHNRFRFHVERIADSFSEHLLQEMLHYDQDVHVLRQPFWFRPEYSVEEYIRFKESLLQPSASIFEMRYGFLFSQMHNLPSYCNVVEMEKLKIAQHKHEKHYEDFTAPGRWVTSDGANLQTVAAGGGGSNLNPCSGMAIGSSNVFIETTAFDFLTWMNIPQRRAAAAIVSGKSTKMGCGHSQPLAAAPTPEGTVIEEANEVPDAYKAGYEASDEKFIGHPFTDYRGVPSSTAVSTAKEKSDGVCSWCDKVLAVREMTGAFFDPQDPTTWPPEVQEYCRRETQKFIFQLSLARSQFSVYITVVILLIQGTQSTTELYVECCC